MHDQRDLQATQQIINLFESSKTYAEDALETLPGIYAVMDAGGSILKGNKTLASLYKVDHEKLLGRQFSDLFLP